MPSKMRGGSPTGGGNIYIFKNKDKAKVEAALVFARFLTTPDKAADWGIATGLYRNATRRMADRRDERRAPAQFPPALVACDQLKEAVAELSTHDNQRVTQVLNDALQAMPNRGEADESRTRPGAGRSHAPARKLPLTV